MNKDKLVGVLMGGPGSEREVSLASGKAVLNALQKAGYQAVGVDVVDTQPVLPEKLDLAFNVIHGTFGEDGGLQTYLEERGIPYTGAGSKNSARAFDKVLSKEAFVAKDVPTPASEVLDLSAQKLQAPSFGLPFVVKPSSEGSSVGVHIVRESSEIKPALQDAAKYGSKVLVEEFVEGKELTVGILDGKALPIVHISPRDGFYDMSNKYPWLTGDGGTDYFCPADLDPATTRKVQEAAEAAHQALQIEVYSRVDVLLDKSGNPYVLEANTIPGMTESSLLPKSAAAAGIDFTQLCLKISELSLKITR